MIQKFMVVYKQGDKELGWNLQTMRWQDVILGCYITQNNDSNPTATKMGSFTAVSIKGFDNVDVYLYNKRKDKYELYVQSVSNF